VAQLTAADTLRISDVHYFWGSFWPTNLADQMRLIVAWPVLDLSNSPLWV
jgi:hypothetical protein